MLLCDRLDRKRLQLLLYMEKQHPYMSPSSSKWRVTVSGELMFLERYGNCDVKITVTLLLDVTKQFFIAISNKDLNSPAVNI